MYIRKIDILFCMEVEKIRRMFINSSEVDFKWEVFY